MKIPTLAALTLASLATALPARAQVLNGSFSLGLTSWNALGDVSIQSGSAFLTTASLLDDDAPSLAAAFNFSGTAAVASSPDLENFSNLAPGALDPNPNSLIYAFEGSALKQSFTVAAGDVLSFQWELLTNDPLADYAYVVINGVKTDLGTSALATTPGSPFSFVTGVNTFSQTFASAQTVNLVFGLVDVNDFSGTTALRIDNVQAVPEPSLAILSALGLFGLACRRPARAPQPTA